MYTSRSANSGPQLYSTSTSRPGSLNRHRRLQLPFTGISPGSSYVAVYFGKYLSAIACGIAFAQPNFAGVATGSAGFAGAGVAVSPDPAGLSAGLSLFEQLETAIAIAIYIQRMMRSLRARPALAARRRRLWIVGAGGRRATGAASPVADASVDAAPTAVPDDVANAGVDLSIQRARPARDLDAAIQQRNRHARRRGRAGTTRYVGTVTETIMTITVTPVARCRSTAKRRRRREVRRQVDEDRRPQLLSPRFQIADELRSLAGRRVRDDRQVHRLSNDRVADASRTIVAMRFRSRIVRARRLWGRHEFKRCSATRRRLSGPSGKRPTSRRWRSTVIASAAAYSVDGCIHLRGARVVPRNIAVIRRRDAEFPAGHRSLRDDSTTSPRPRLTKETDLRLVANYAAGICVSRALRQRRVRARGHHVLCSQRAAPLRSGDTGHLAPNGNLRQYQSYDATIGRARARGRSTRSSSSKRRSAHRAMNRAQRGHSQDLRAGARGAVRRWPTARSRSAVLAQGHPGGVCGRADDGLARGSTVVPARQLVAR